MKILEVRDGFIKFEADESISLSSFIQVSGLAKNYIAQIIQIKRSGINSIAIAKILFLYDGTLQPYDKTLPPEDSEIKDFTFNILNNSINANEPIIAGVMPGKDLNIIIDASAFDKKMLMSIDDKEENNIIVRNLTKQFNNINKKVVIIDTLGIINAKKFTAGVDFKLPLDTASLAFMYQDCLNDATSDSKSLIVEIFKDLADYSKTVPFVPFETLKNIVDDMVDKSHVFKLLVLKNKLAKFHKLGYFAKNKVEADKIDRILEQSCSVIDLSKLDSSFQNRYLAFLYEKMLNKNDLQVFLELSNTTSKKNLKNILEGSVPTTFITHSKFKYLNDIKNLFDNFIISPSLTNNDIFKVYKTFLKSLCKGTYLIAGEAVNYIPLISSSKLINEVIPCQKQEITEEEKTEENAIDKEEAPLNTESVQEEVKADSSSEEDVVAADADGTAISEPEEISEDDIEASLQEESDNTDISEPETIEPEIIEEDKEDENTENILSNEEIIANIEEQSDNIISNAAKEELVPPADNLFFSDDSSDDEELVEKDLEFQTDNLEQEQSERAVIGETLEEISVLENSSEEDFLEENPISLSENDEILQEAISEDTIEEIPLEDAFENDIETSEEIQDYIPVENLEPEEITLDSEIENILPEEEVEDEIPEAHIEEITGEDKLEEVEMPEAPIEEISDENNPEEIEIPEDIDIDLENVEDEKEEVQPLEEMSSEQEVLPISTDDNSDFDEIVELDPNEADEDDILVDMTEDDLEEDTRSEEDIDKQIVKDVDKVFTTRKDDDISDSDLDFIDELNNDENILEDVSDEGDLLEEDSSSSENEGILESNNETIDLEEDNENEILETKNSSTPIVPVYNADIPQEDMVVSDPIQQGDTVTHAKYGSGVVEKMIKYGNKTLFSINFDNIGRRLLDPTLTEIKKA